MELTTTTYNTIAQIPIRGVEKYAFFYESYLKPALLKYKKKKIAGEDIAELCAGRNTYNLYHVVDVWKDGKPIDRRLFRTDSTMNSLLTEAKEKGYALLYRGFFAIPGRVWNEYRQNKNRLKVFKLDRLTRMAQYVIADLDGIDFEKLKRVVKYLHSLGIYPEVWESASGEGNYHIYINLVGMVERWKEKKEDGEEEHRRYYLPYASDYRVSLAVEGLKELFKHHLGIPYDSISTDRAVWLEGFPNPQKQGRASKKIWNGKPHRLDSLTEKLKPFWEKYFREEAKKEYFTFKAHTNEKTRLKKTVGSIEICEEKHSNPIDYLQANVVPTFRMLDKGYAWAQIEQQLRTGWNGDQKAFDRAFKGFEAWIEAAYKPMPKPKAKPRERKKHTHYWEHIPKIYEVLQQDGLDSSINHVHKKTGIAKSTLSNIFKIVSKEQILSSPEEAQELLKAYQKGGDRMTEEQKQEARERGKERWKDYLERFLKESIKARKKSLGDKGKKALKKPFKGEALVSFKGVQIGSISIIPTERKGAGGEREKVQKSVKVVEKVVERRVIEGIDRPKLPEVAAAAHSLTQEELEEERRRELQKELERELRKAEERKWKKKAWELIEKIERIWELRVGFTPGTKSYVRLVFGAVDSARKGQRRTYDLSRWGSYAEALERVLRELGHEVREKEEPTPIFTDFQPNLPMPSGSSRGDDDDGIEELLDF